MASTVEERLQELGLTLPKPSQPVANFVSTVRTGNLLFLAGLFARTPEGKAWSGKLGDTMDVEEGYQSARSAGLRAIAVMKEALGDLERVRRIVRVLGMVNATPDFTAHPRVLNGTSDLLVEVFGEQGRHTRCAVGMSSLPSGAAVEIEVIVEVTD